MTTDRIEKKIRFGPRDRGSGARSRLPRSSAPGSGERSTERFAPGARVSGNDHLPRLRAPAMDITIERVEPERLFSYRWHPVRDRSRVDYSAEPTTLVEFRLEEVPGGTQLTVIESGFDRLPAGPSRRGLPDERGRLGRAAPERRAPCRHVAPRAALAAAAPLFSALGDETRLAVVARLCAGGPQSITRSTAGSARHAAGHHQAPERAGRRRPRPRHPARAGAHLGARSEAPRTTRAAGSNTSRRAGTRRSSGCARSPSGDTPAGAGAPQAPRSGGDPLTPRSARPSSRAAPG